MRISDWIDRELAKKVQAADSRGEYEAEVSKREALAQKLVAKALKEKDSIRFSNLVNTIADRTEGKPLQRTDVTSDGERMQSVLLVKPEKMEE